MANAAFYIDGFNLYHAIDDLAQPHLKWVNLWALAARMIPQQSQTLVRVVWCTAVKTDDPAKMQRHREYRKALEAAGVSCLPGHFATETRTCNSCGHTWSAPIEKQGDVNLAISLIDDAHRGVFDHAYLVTADSDQAATVQLFQKRFKDAKAITVVAPPGREHSKEILRHNPLKTKINVDQLEWCLFDRAPMNGGAVVAIRPSTYDPPPGWVHPSKRP